MLTEIHYYKSPSDIERRKDIVGFIPFSEATTVTLQDEKIHIETDGRTWQLAATDSSDADRWARGLKLQGGKVQGLARDIAGPWEDDDGGGGGGGGDGGGGDGGGSGGGGTWQEHHTTEQQHQQTTSRSQKQYDSGSERGGGGGLGATRGMGADVLEVATQSDVPGWTQRDIGQRVFVEQYGFGMLRFVGLHQISGKPRCGIELDEPFGKNNGAHRSTG
jgi:hypothetical protein